jgi:flagellar basal body-associated protein FliL
MSNQWLGSKVCDPQRQQALRMDGIIIIVIIIIIVVVVVVVVVVVGGK